jgi:hypothetical protein
MSDHPVVRRLASVLRDLRELPDGCAGRAHDREVRVEHTRGIAVDWIVLRSPICAAIELDARKVVERHARLAFATIVLADGLYWLRVSVPSDSAELADPTRLIGLLVEAAGSLAPNRIGPTHLFDHYAS